METMDEILDEPYFITNPLVYLEGLTENDLSYDEIIFPNCKHQRFDIARIGPHTLGFIFYCLNETYKENVERFIVDINNFIWNEIPEDNKQVKTTKNALFYKTINGTPYKITLEKNGPLYTYFINETMDKCVQLNNFKISSDYFKDYVVEKMVEYDLCLYYDPLY